MKPIDITILTDQTNLPQPNSAKGGLTGYIEDTTLKETLLALGLKVERKAWDDPDFDWSSTKAAIFRSTWDYFYRFQEFEPWLNNVSQQTKLINSKNLIYWNIDKHYLQDLSNKGVHIAKSHFIEKGSQTTLQKLYNTLNCSKAVLKPCVSGTARHTYILERSNLNEYESIFQELIAKEAMLLQPFQEDIVKRGEVSMVVINGQYTHAILKKAKPGDFRVQEDFGGTFEMYIPTDAEIIFAEQAINACNELPLYARVDIINDNEGKIALMELELIEPELWIRKSKKATQLLAQAIKNYLD